ncbi:hypothetical protein [Winogradskyella vidalii]|uniref:hypothetical protein n=1 Tax=Winogradskyella vidalii TaxID=2615024 RepID=UPI0015C89ADF|nr:hypothetical protein [Winogradskyella vidalii]
MKKFLKQISFSVFLFVLINLIVLSIYEYPAYEAIKNKTHKNYLKWNDIHSNTNTYDLIILGSSRAYTAYNPDIIDKGLNLKSYNMGTSAQDIAESYYSLKEILEYQNPKYIVLEMFLPSSDNSHDFYQIFSNASFFNSYQNKYDLVVDGYGEKGITNYFIPLSKFNNYIKQDLGSLFAKKEEKTQNNRWIRGYLYDTTSVTKKQINKFKPISNFENTTFNQKRFQKYFNKIYKLTQKHNIKLICVRSPYPPSRIALSKVQDEKEFYNTFLFKYGIPFYDFNTYKSYEYNDFEFSDYHHANYRGAEKISKQLIEVIQDY